MTQLKDERLLFGRLFDLSVRQESVTVGYKKVTYIMVQARRGQIRQRGMRFEAVNDPAFIAGEKLDDLLRLFVPNKNVTAIASTYHVFRPGTVKVNALVK